MPQLLLQGFPDGAIRIGSTLSVLKKEGRVTYLRRFWDLVAKKAWVA